MTVDLGIMNEMVIDPETGLPQLPENHFWEIGLDETKNDVLRLKLNTEVRKYRKVDVFETKGIWPFRKKIKTGTELTEEYDMVPGEVILRQKNFTYKVYLDEKTEEVLERDKYLVPDFAVLGYKGWSFNCPTQEVTIPLNPEGILFLAGILWADLRVAVKSHALDELHKEAQEKYHGQYPPKSIGV